MIYASRVRWTRGRGGLALDESERAKLIDDLVTAEATVAADPGVGNLVRQALGLSGAETVWMRIEPDQVVRAGHRRRDSEVSALLQAASLGSAADAPSPAGLFVHRLPSGGAIAFGYPQPRPGAEQASAAIARWVGHRMAQRSLADESARAASAELRALRAQISPHFVFNAMGAIAALIRIDPERARSLLLDFADYTRYSFGRHGEYTTFAEELRSTEIYLSLERARFGDRLGVRVTVAPEVLSVPVPFLVLQPLVENAVRHGIEPLAAGGRVSVLAEDEGAVIRIEIDDDGAGADPAAIEALLGDDADADAHTHVGLRNIDERLRAVYGDSHGLVVDTAPGAGTRVTLRIPKYRPNVLA